MSEKVLNADEELKKFEELVNKKNKYELTVEEIYNNIGGKENYSKFYNCVSRFRIVIKDKSFVDEDAIKKIHIVKGINWNGNELQIIIGGEVYKITAAFQSFVNTIASPTDNKRKYQSNLEMQVNRSFKDKILAAVTGIIIPALPVIMAAGLLKAVQAILAQTGLIQQVNLGSGEGQLPNIASYDLFTIIVYIIAEAGLSFMGIYFCYNTVKFLGGNEVMGVFVGLALVCPFFYSNGEWLSYELFKIGDISIAIKGYQSSIIPQVCAGLTFFYINRWASKWIPASIDIVLRPAFSFLVTMLVSFIVVGPIMNIIESGVYATVVALNNIPYGIGVGIFTMIWQPLVLTGMHYPIIMPIMLDQAANDTTSVILVGTTIAVLGQAGAALAIFVKSKSAQTKQISLGSLPAAFFGVTEPAIYGVTLPTFKPFLWGCFAAGIAGFISGVLGVHCYAGSTPSMGLIFVVGFVRGGASNIILGILVFAIAAALSFIFVFFTYKDRTDEVKSIKKINKGIAIIYAQKTGNKLDETQQQRLDNLINLISKEDTELFKSIDIKLAYIERLYVQIEMIRAKEDQQKDQVVLKVRKAIAKEDTAKLEVLKAKLEKINYNEKIAELSAKKLVLENELEPSLNELIKIQDSFLTNARQVLEEFAKEIQFNELKDLETNYFNAIHSVDIAYGKTEKQEITLTRKVIKRSLNVKTV